MWVAVYRLFTACHFPLSQWVSILWELCISMPYVRTFINDADINPYPVNVENMVSS